MTDKINQLNFDIPAIPKKIYEFYKIQKFSKMSDYVKIFIFHLDSSSKNTYQIEEINFISEICVKACKKLIKQKKIDHQLITLTSELTSKYSNSTRIIYMGKLNLAQSLLIEGKFTEAKDSIKSTLKVIVNYPDCIDLSSKLYLILSQIYLKEEGKHEKSLKFSQKALDQCFKKANSSHESSFFKCVIEALYCKGLYYVKILEFQQAERILEKIKEISNEKSLCKHLNANIHSLNREINLFLSRRSTEKPKSRTIKHSSTFDLSPCRYIKSKSSFTVLPSKSLQDCERNKIYNESLASIKIQTFYRMFTQRKKYLAKRSTKVLASKKKSVNGAEYVFSGCINTDNDVIISAIPLMSGINQPKSKHIFNIKRKDYGLEDPDQVSNLLEWVSIVGNNVFVPHTLSKKRLIFKTTDYLMSEHKFYVKVFETEKLVTVQAAQDEVFEISFDKKNVPMQFIISPMLLINKIRFDTNKLVYN